MATAAAALGALRVNQSGFDAPEDIRSNLDRMLNEHFKGNSCLLGASAVLDSLFEGIPIDCATLDLDPRDSLFVQNLLSLRPYVVSAGRFRHKGLPIKRLGVDQDCLAEGASEWSVFRLLNIAVMDSIVPSERAAIVTSVRNEGLNILEWLAHHRATGFEKFFVYSNDNTDGSEKILQILAEFGIINLIENSVGPEAKIQAKILEHSLQLMPELREFDWAFYIDVDEFFIPRCEPGLKLDSFFLQFNRAFQADFSPSAICFNWKWFGSENAFEAEDRLLLERFVYSIHNEHVKSMVRLRDAISMHRVHAPVLVKGAWLVNSHFERVDAAIKMKPTYDKGQLNHYWNKSFQEFALKRARGRISRGLNGEPLDFTSFFDWGSNGKRGNLDGPDPRIIERLHDEYRILLSIPGILSNLKSIRSNQKKTLDELDRELDISALYERRGRALSK